MRTPELDRDRAEQRNQAESAEAGDAAAFGKLAILPSALEAHQQADGEGDCQPSEKVRVFQCHALASDHLMKGAAAKTISISMRTATMISRVIRRRSRATSRTSSSASWMLRNFDSRAA